MFSSSSCSSSSFRTWVLSVKAIFISLGIISVAILMKHTVPLVFHYLRTQLPLLWGCVLSWLRPPYLYLLINAIIISIAASSRFNQTREGSNETRTDCPQEIEPVIGGGMVPEEKTSSVVVGNTEEKEENEEREEKEEKEHEEEEEEEEEFVISKSNLMASEEKKKKNSPDKPLVTSRFVHRRTVRSSPEGGRTLGVNRPRRQETLETTWKAITEGRPMPLTRHLKKSETWENHNPQTENSSPNQLHRIVRKSETFKDRTNEMLVSPSTPSPVKMRKEPSLSQDELNRRVEAFINKFNEEMRLQRQESLNQYMEMMSRGL